MKAMMASTNSNFILSCTACISETYSRLDAFRFFFSARALEAASASASSARWPRLALVLACRSCAAHSFAVARYTSDHQLVIAFPYLSLQFVDLTSKSFFVFFTDPMCSLRNASSGVTNFSCAFSNIRSISSSTWNETNGWTCAGKVVQEMRLTQFTRYRNYDKLRTRDSQNPTGRPCMES